MALFDRAILVRWILRPRAIFLVLVATTMAPELVAQALPPLDEYHVRAYRPEDGLLNADVRGLAQTSDGYLYVASSRGLARFDGYAFHEVPLPGLRSKWLQWIHRDMSDRLWLLTTEGELAYLEDGRLHVLPTPPVELHELTETSDGSLWFGTAEGLLRVDPGGSEPFSVMTAPGALARDTVQGVYGPTAGDLVAIGRRSMVRLVPHPTEPGRRKLEAIPAGDAPSLAFGPPRWNGVQVPTEFAGFFRHSDDAVMAAGFDREHVLHAFRTSDGGRWRVGVPEGTGWAGPRHLLHLQDGVFRPIALRAHFDFTRIQHILEDHEGSLWIGTDRGLFQLAPHRAYALTERHGLAEAFTVPVLETTDGSLWVGTWGGGLHRFADGRLAARYTSSGGLSSDMVRALYEADDGALWVGMRGSVAVIDGGRIVRADSIGYEIRAFARTRDGTFWIGGADELLFHRGDGGAHRPGLEDFVEHDPEFWQDKEIWALHGARDGALWIGSERGLFRLAGDSLRAFGSEDGLRSGFVVSIYEEPDGTLWFGTYAGGLHRYRDGRFAAVTTAEGLHHDGVWRILPDDLGGYWMSSDLGIFRVDRERLHAVADAVERGDEPPVRLRSLVFSEAEGMPSRECNRASPGGSRLADGRLVFNNLAGLVVIDPARALRSRAAPAPVLSNMIADGDTVAPVGAAPRLEPDTRQLVFEFTGLSFLAPEQILYRYRLDGYDEAWVDVGSQRRAVYTQLPPGRYVFRAQAAARAGSWTEGAAYAFVVPPRVWQTWWFRLAVLAAAASLLYAAHRYRMRTVLQMERLRLRIASDLHDDVGSTLSSIALLSEMLYGRARKLEQLDRRQVERIHAAAEQTIDGLRDVIWLVDPKHDTLADLVERMRTTAGQLLNGVPYEFEAPPGHRPRSLNMTFMRNAFLVYKEALHNVVKHSGADRVRIHIGDEHGVFTLTVADDGCGFDPAACRRGYGLDSMRARAERLRGSLLIESIEGGGTRLIFRARMA